MFKKAKSQDKYILTNIHESLIIEKIPVIDSMKKLYFNPVEYGSVISMQALNRDAKFQ